jgi:hypothetical protein
LQESGFALLGLGIEAVRRFKQSAKQFEGKARSEKPQDDSERPEVMVSFPAKSAPTQPQASHPHV